VSEYYLLDTDTVVDVLRGRHHVVDRLATVSPDDVALSAMSLAELLYGAVASRDAEKNHREVMRFVSHIRVLPFGRRAATVHAALRWGLRQQPIGPNDLVIAATALAVGARLVTANAKEFGRVPDLVVESWRSK